MKNKKDTPLTISSSMKEDMEKTELSTQDQNLLVSSAFKEELKEDSENENISPFFRGEE